MKNQQKETTPLTTDKSVETGFIPTRYKTNNSNEVKQIIPKKEPKKKNFDFNITISKPNKRITRILILIFSLLLLFTGALFGMILIVKRDHRSSAVNHHGIGKLGIKCPNNTAFHTVSIDNSFGCCSFFEYTCARSPTCSEKKNYNSILNGRSNKCDNQLGLLSCAPLSPYVNYFAPNIQIGDHWQNINICDSFCENIYESCLLAKFDCSFFNSFPHHHCGKRVDVIYPDAYTFCQKALYVNVSSELENCFSSAKSFQISRNLIVFILLLWFRLLL
ncbi:folate receptor family protein [Anaeramoeba flamelloides]|uniref:Folate receptor family protein n=1 Tax=Anaeramoeba flamelloides TaxID=1746091 RepID=A0ABQ8XRY9_9EUKA|nr:folate receptor family protein [Anaeramoeba flamelloides]